MSRRRPSASISAASISAARISAAVAALAVAALAIAGCGAPTTEAEGGSPAGTVAASAPAAAGVPEVLQFNAPLVGGGDFGSATFVDRPMAFWFWAPT